ncbi:hypothetical protein AVEN_156165-1 [Araneus ventricosus]|uniref:Uncharacterized protein n=1 Tax=Araneus ventricosus TaxID=182803 RepID=A0A4Y2QYF4_ARAVE|nr:hypothetical protein AVEN_156165-1 [Araneus ventricosus]
MSRFTATRGIFIDRYRNFESRLDDEDETGTSAPLSKFPLHTTGWSSGPYGFNMKEARLHGDSSMESVFEPGGLRPRSRDFTTRAPRLESLV